MLPIPIPTTPTFFMEVVLPGVFGAILAYPLLPEWAQVHAGAVGLAGFTGVALLIGFVAYLMRFHLLEFAAGRYWIPRLRDHAIKRLQSRVNEAREDVVKSSAGSELPPPPVFHRLWPKQKLIDSMMVGSGGTRLVYAPTVIGNAYLAIITDLLGHFEVEERLKGNMLAAITAPSAVARAWYLLPRDIRTEIAETGAVGVALSRFAAIAGGIAIIYPVHIAFAPSGWLRDVLLAIVAVAVARVAYLAAVGETHSMLQTTRLLLTTVDRDTAQAFKELLRTQAQALAQPQAQPPSGQGPQSPIGGVKS